MLKRFWKDEKGLYLFLSLAFFVMILLPTAILITELGRYFVARMEAQVAIDAMSLAISNDSKEKYQTFKKENDCGDTIYLGKEYYLAFIGQNEAQSLANKYFTINKKNFVAVNDVQIHGIDVKDEYKPATDTEQNIPQSIKNQSHYPNITVTANFTYTPYFDMMGNTVDFTLSSKTEKAYNEYHANRVELYPSHPPCPRLPSG